MVRLAGLDVVDTRGMSFNLLTRQYFLQDDVSVNYMVASQKAA